MQRKRRAFCLFAVFALLLAACSAGTPDRSALVLTADAAEEETTEPPVETQAEAPFQAVAETTSVVVSQEPATIMVHVCGAVNRAGVYTLDEGSRVCQAVAAAGGFSSDADEAYINQAEILQDGVRLRIPTMEETAALSETEVRAADAQETLTVISGGGATGAETAVSDGGKININTADAETLCRLNGIGTSTAAKIIAYREANGAFSRIEDIMQVSGIKEKLFAKIKEDITV